MMGELERLIEYMQPVSWAGLGTCILCGVIIGLERQLSGKPAGIRTSILICLGTYSFVVLSTVIEGGTTDASRVVGQIVTGIGFLGGGLMMQRDGLVKGVTSAAVIWLLAAIGALIGFSNYGAAILMSVLCVAVLTIVGFIEHKIKKLRTGVHEEDE